MFDLTDGQYREISRILTEHVPECEIRVFGSRANGTNRAYSDLDLAIKCAEEIEFSRMNRLKEAFENSRLPLRVDIVDVRAVSEKFNELALKDSVLFGGL